MSTSKDSNTPDSTEESAQERTPEEAKAAEKATGTTTPLAKGSPAKGSTKAGAQDDEEGAADTSDKTVAATKDEATKDEAKVAGKKTSGRKTKSAASDAEDKSASKRRRGTRPQPIPGMNPTWWAPVMCTLMVVGLLWIVVFYLLSNGTKDTWPIPGIGYGNLAIGFGMIMAGFLMTTRWK